MKKNLFALLSIILCFCFCLSGCNLFTENSVIKANQIAIESGNITLTREEFLKGYNSYYSTFYSNNNSDADAAMEDLIEYLVTKKIYIEDAKALIESGEIVLTDTEKNYVWYSVYSALINNIKTFEDEIKKELNIEDEEDEDLDQESNFVYTAYDKIADVIYNEETGEYEISIIKTVLVEKTDEETGEKLYEYVSEGESTQYTLTELFSSDYIKNLINENKLYSDKIELTSEEEYNKSISKEAIRRYILQLKENEEGKSFSTDNDSIFEREIDRIYEIVYNNIVINKLYAYKVSGIDISEEDVLNRYLEKVKESYERYLLDEDSFTDELTKTVGSAKYYAGYSTESECIEDVFYVPVDTTEGAEKYFFVTHIVVKLSESQVQQINELKQYCEANGLDNTYYTTEFNKIVDKSKIKLDERDKEGYIIVKSTDDDSISVEQMITSLGADLQLIDDEYDLLDGTEDDIVSLNALSTEDYYGYINARADKFNEYIYKYSDDTGTLQIQNTITDSKTNENWYLYGLGTDETDASFVDNFVEAARSLYTAGKVTETSVVLMQNWSTTDGVETLKTGSTGYSVLMYCGNVTNLFECFDSQEFDLEDLLSEEVDNNEAKYYSLLKMDYKRLGLTMNKTLFDLVFEECYNDLYNNIITAYQDSVKDGLNIVTHESVYSDILG